MSTLKDLLTCHLNQKYPAGFKPGIINTQVAERMREYYPDFSLSTLYRYYNTSFLGDLPLSLCIVLSELYDFHIFDYEKTV